VQKILDIHFLVDTSEAVGQNKFSVLEKLITFGITAHTAFGKTAQKGIENKPAKV
jgi:hypothetical protein